MHNSLTEKSEKEIVSFISLMIMEDRDTCYKNFMSHLLREKKYDLRCRMLLNRHVYGSLVRKAENNARGI